MCIISNPLVNSNWSYTPETLNSGRNRRFFVPYDLEIWWMTSKNNRAPLLCCFKLCASFHSHQWIQTGVNSPEMPNLGQIRQFLKPSDLEIWQMTLQTIGHLFYATSSFVHHFIAIGEFKFELQSGNAQFRSKATIVWAMWPRNFTNDPQKQ